MLHTSVQTREYLCTVYYTIIEQWTTSPKRQELCGIRLAYDVAFFALRVVRRSVFAAEQLVAAVRLVLECGLRLARRVALAAALPAAVHSSVLNLIVFRAASVSAASAGLRALAVHLAVHDLRISESMGRTLVMTID